MDAHVKFLLVGSSMAGKSCLVRRYASAAAVAAAAAEPDSDSDATVATLFNASTAKGPSRPSATMGFDASSKVLRGVALADGEEKADAKLKLFFLDTSGNPEEGAKVRALAYGPSLVAGVATSTVPTALVVLLVADCAKLRSSAGGDAATVEAVAKATSEGVVAPALAQLSEVSEKSVVVRDAAAAAGSRSYVSFVLVGAKADLVSEAFATTLRAAFASVVAEHGLNSFLLTSSAGAEEVEGTAVYAPLNALATAEARRARTTWAAEGAASPSVPATVVEAPAPPAAAAEEFPMWNVSEAEMKAQMEAYEKATASAGAEGAARQARKKALRRGLVAAVVVVAAAAFIVKKRSARQ